MHTKDKLADALTGIGLTDMAARAHTGYYDDFLSDLPTPCLQLTEELQKIGTIDALALRKRVINGEFDGTLEESEAWMRSPEGQLTIKQLLGKK